MRVACLLALALVAGVAPDALPFAERPAPKRGKDSCDCTPRCICGCQQGKPCSCAIYPAPRPYPQFPAAGECEACRAEAWKAVEEVNAAQNQEPFFNETLAVLRGTRFDVMHLWEVVRDLQRPDTEEEYRERAAQELVDLIGVEAFINGWLPPPR